MRRERTNSQQLFKKSADLAKRTEQSRKDMINAELTTIASFCDRAETSIRLGKLEHARKSLAEAEKGVLAAKEQINKLAPQDDDGTDLKKALADLESRLEQIEKAA